jgi:hypothetical protein
MSKGSKRRKYVLYAIVILLCSVTLIGAYYYVWSLTGVDVSPERIRLSVNADKNGTLVITLDYNNFGPTDATVKTVYIDGVSINNYTTLIDVYDASGTSIRNLLKGYVMPSGKEGKFVMGFTKDAFASGQLIHMTLRTKESAYPIDCRIP